jgi:hypothetical protein
MMPENITKYFPVCDETPKGHMRQTKQGVRSTKVLDEDAMLQATPSPGVKHKDVYLCVFDSTKKAMYTDQMGRFPMTSVRGNKYIMVAIKLDGTILMPNLSRLETQKHSLQHTNPSSNDGRPQEQSAQTGTF